MPLPAGTRLGPYEILSALGAGGMGEVYKARDDRLGRDVALKFLSERLTQDPVAVERFTREARAASALNHPNIVTIYDVGESAAGRFVAMELVRGRTLRALLSEGPAVAVAARIGEQIARALAVAHESGIVHRDIKPENVMVREDGYVKVLDFGLARLLGQSPAASAAVTVPATEAGSLLGTTRYMSPEQAQGDPVDTATDIFSLGIVVYELATGEHPFASDSSYGVLHKILSDPPLAPSRLIPSMPAELEALILQMLQKPTRRRPSAREVTDGLAAVVSKSSTIQASLAPAPAAGRVRHQTVGRASERAALGAAFDQAVAGAGLLVCVSGEPGIGKTTVVEEFLGGLEAGLVACHVGRGRCSERLAGTEAYLPWLEALETLLRGDASQSINRSMKRLAPTWHWQIAPLAAEEAGTPAPAESRAGSQERMKRELGAFFQEVTRLAPVALFFDDLHWADASTVDLLSYLAARFGVMRLLIVGTYRPSDLLLANHPFLSLKLDLQGRGLCRELPLELLSRDDVERYLALQFPQHRFSGDFPALIHAKTEGSPLFMVDLLRYLRDREVIAQHDGQWVLAETLPHVERELPESVRSMIRRKIDQLSDGDRRLLVAASVQGYEFEAAVVAKALAADPGEVEERLEHLDRVHGFVGQARELELPAGTLTARYRFVHVLYQNALYASLTPTRRAALSSAVAEALQGFYGDQTAAIASQVALLFEVARDLPRAVDQFLLAAQHAAAVFANREAALLARKGLDLLKALPHTPERTRLELKFQTTLGVALRNTKGFAAPEVGAVYAKALELSHQTREEREVFPTLRGLWEFYELRGEFQTALELADQCLHLAQTAQDPELLLVAHDISGDTRVWLGEFLAAREHLEQGIALYDPQRYGSHPSVYGYDSGAACLMFLAAALWHLGFPDQAVQRCGEAVDCARRVSHPMTLAVTQSSAAWVHQLRREGRAAEEWADAAIEVSREHEIPFCETWAGIMRGWALASQGSIDEGIAVLQQALAGWRAIGCELARPWALALLAEAHGSAGRPEDGLRAVAEALEEVNKTGERWYEAEVYRIRGELLLAQASDNAADAEACFRRGLEIGRRQQAKSLELRATTSVSRLLQRQGRRDEARQMLAKIYGWFTEGFDTADLKEAKALLDELS